MVRCLLRYLSRLHLHYCPQSFCIHHSLRLHLSDLVFNLHLCLFLHLSHPVFHLHLCLFHSRQGLIVRLHLHYVLSLEVHHSLMNGRCHKKSLVSLHILIIHRHSLLLVYFILYLSQKTAELTFVFLLRIVLSMNKYLTHMCTSSHQGCFIMILLLVVVLLRNQE